MAARARKAADEAAHRPGDAGSHARRSDPALHQHARAARERPEVLVAAVAFEVEVVVGEHGDHFEEEEAEQAEPECRGIEPAGRLHRAGRADGVRAPGHRMELQPHRGNPGAERLAPALGRGQHALAQPQSVRSGLLQPALTRGGIRILHHAEDGGAHRLDAAETERGPGKAVQPRRLVDPAVDPRRRVHRGEEMGRSSGEELVPAASLVVLFEREAGHQYPVEEALQQRRHRAPPGREHEHQVVRPPDQLDRFADGRLERLVARRAGDHVGIELQLAEVEPPEVDARLPCPGGKRLRQRPAQAVLARVAQDEQYLEAGAHDRQTRRRYALILSDWSCKAKDARPQLRGARGSRHSRARGHGKGVFAPRGRAG